MWDAVLSEAAHREIPRLSLEGFAEFWERRAKITVRACHGSLSTWEVTAPEASPDVSLRVPLPKGATLTWDGKPAAVTWRDVHGAPYASVRLPDAAGTWRLSALP